jgi:hypothetical protein
MLLQLRHNLGWREVIGKRKLDAHKARHSGSAEPFEETHLLEQKAQISASIGIEIPNSSRWLQCLHLFVGGVRFGERGFASPVGNAGRRNSSPLEEPLLVWHRVVEFGVVE